MTFVAAVAAGDGAVDDLRSRYAAPVASGEVAFVRHGGLGVAWQVGSRWVDSHDNGDVLVVLDGRLHNLWSCAAGGAELLARRYAAMGAGVAAGLFGDFVVIVLDRTRGSLLVARDPVGVRPWYQAASGRQHAGASDVATLTALPWVDTGTDERVAIEYLAAVTASRGETLHRGITTLRPGETWRSVGGRATTSRHHRWRLEPELDISWDDAAERCRAALDVAVDCRLRGSGPPTSELSGGLDSSAVVGTVVGLGRHDLVAARLVFDGPGADERLYSDAVAGHWRIPLVSASPWRPAGDEAADLTRRLRRPLPDPHFLMFVGLHETLLAQGRPDGLTGLGGDDAFVTARMGSRVVSAVQLRQWSVLGALGRSALRHRDEAWTGLLRPTLHHLAPWRGDRLPGWVRGEAAERAGLPRLFRRRAPRLTGVAAVDERATNLTTGYDAAILQDRALVADLVGRRDSHPFLDPRVVEATYGLDPWWPSRGGHTRALQVAAFADRLPPSVAERRTKAEFSEVFWPQLLDDETLAGVRTGPLAAYGWLDPDGFDQVVVNAKRGMANAAIPLARCIALDRWVRTQ
jgi:asparagine synthase (glutamine-hydrolysing)